MPYTALQSMLDAGFPSGLQVHWRSEFLASIPDELIDALVSAYERVPSPLSAILIEQFGGAVHRVPGDSTAFDNRDSDFNLVIVSRWADPRGRRAQCHLGASDVGRGEAIHDRSRVRQLHRRGRGAGSRARGIRPRQVRAARAGQTTVRSAERVPDQSEHPARLALRQGSS